MENGCWNFSNLPQPLFSERGAFFSARPASGRHVRSLEKENFFFKKKTTVFSLFLKREGEAGIKKIGCG